MFIVCTVCVLRVVNIRKRNWLLIIGTPVRRSIRIPYQTTVFCLPQCLYVYIPSTISYIRGPADPSNNPLAGHLSFIVISQPPFFPPLTTRIFHRVVSFSFLRVHLVINSGYRVFLTAVYHSIYYIYIYFTTMIKQAYVINL